MKILVYKRVHGPGASPLWRLHLLDEHVLVGEFPGFVLRIDELAVDVDVEDAARAFDQEGLFAERVLDLCSQTDRFGFVASGSAVGDGDVH